MRDRAWRRKQRERKKNRFRFITMNIWGDSPDKEEQGHYQGGSYEQWLNRLFENMPICSSPGCCGNARKRGCLTRPEVRALVDEFEQRGLDPKKVKVSIL
jgi:hypothetical protein